MSVRNKKNNNYNNPNFWGMIQNVLIASLNKGQFLIGIFGMILIIIVIKMPSYEIKNLFLEILIAFKDLGFIGWILSTILAFGWFYSNKKLRKLYSEEFNRIGQEKTDLQNKINKGKLKTSKG